MTDIQGGLPETGSCARCRQTRPLFAPKPEWGWVPGLLCSTDWQRYADARANGTFVDANDAFDNATDEQFEAGLNGGAVS